MLGMFFFGFTFMLFFMMVAVTRHAIKIIKLFYREAKVTFFVYQRQTRREIGGIHCTAFQGARLLIFIGYYRCVPRNIRVVGFTLKTIYMKGDIFLSASQVKAAKLAVVYGGIVGFYIALKAGRYFARDAVIHHVHHAADSATAILQSSRAAQYFNLGRTGAVGRYVMVRANTRYVGHIQTILHNLNPWTIITAYYRATGNRAEVSAVHPGSVF